MIRKRMAIGLIVAFLGFGRMLAVSATAAPTTAPSPTTSASIEIDNFHFKPDELTVKVGTTVTWINRDDVPHTATAKGDSPAFDSKALDTDEKFSFTFDRSGTYSYYCKVHPHMTGKIIVK